MAVSLLAATEARAQAPATVTVLVAYHSVTGNTEKMAQGVADGAKEISGANGRVVDRFNREWTVRVGAMEPVAVT